MFVDYIIDNGREDVTVPVDIPEPNAEDLKRYAVWNEQKIVDFPKHRSISVKLTSDGGIATALMLKNGNPVAELFCHFGNNDTDRLLTLMKSRNYSGRSGREFITPAGLFWIYQVRLDWSILSPMDNVFLLGLIYPIFGVLHRVYVIEEQQRRFSGDVFAKN